MGAIEQLATVPETEHSALIEHVRYAHRLKAELVEKRQQAIGNLQKRAIQAQEHNAQRRYAEALACLEQIPASLRNRQAQILHEELRAILDEIALLRREVREALKQGGGAQLYAKVGRLHELEPQAEDVTRLWHKVNEQRQKQEMSLACSLLKQARGAIVGNDYVRAEAFLQKMPKTLPEDSRELYEAVQERVWLARQVMEAPFADKTLLAFATRLMRLQPKDTKVAEWHGSIKKRLAHEEPRAGHPFAHWAKVTGSPRLGAPVEPFPHATKFSWASSDATLSACDEDPRCFLTAAGLALVGLGKGNIDLDLRPNKSSWRGRLTNVPTIRRPRDAWGLDLGNGGLKYLRLHSGKEGEVRIDCAGVIPYKTDKLSTDMIDMQQCHSAAIEEFFDQQGPGNAPIVLNLPGTQTLCRYFTLPKCRSKRKFQKALLFELDNLIPLPLEEIVYGTHNWSAPVKGRSDANQVDVTLVSSKREHIELRVSPFVEAKTNVASLQSEGVALINVLHYCCNDELAALQSGEAIALIEIGLANTNIVVSTSSSACFRAVHRGVRDLNKSLAKEFGVTLRQADTFRKYGKSAKTMYRIDTALRPAIEELTHTVQHALGACLDALGSHLVRVYVAGGGCNQYGLLRHWALAEVQSDADQYVA